MANVGKEAAHAQSDVLKELEVLHSAANKKAGGRSLQNKAVQTLAGSVSSAAFGKAAGGLRWVGVESDADDGERCK